MGIVSLIELKWMHQALSLAQQAQTLGEVPVGAVIVANQKIIGQGFNACIAQNDASAHAEIMAIRQAGQTIKNYRITDTTLYVTLEPCAMCVGAMIHARIKQLIFGAYDNKTGCVTSIIKLLHAPHFNHQISYTAGILEAECAQLLRGFFQKRRQGLSDLGDTNRP